MIEIDDAICAQLAADTVLAAILGGDAISGQWPDAEATYSSIPAGTTDYASLPPVEPPYGRVTILLISPSEDAETPVHDDDYQIDIWSRSPRLNAAAAARVRAVLDRKGLPASGVRVTETYCSYGPELFDDVSGARLFHKVLNYHVTWIG